MPQKSQDRYEIKTCSPGELTAADLTACIALIKSGNAVDPNSAAAELPRAIVLAVARRGEQLVGVGTIKRARPGYAARIAARSGATFKPDTPELGYVAVDSHHQGQKLSHRLVAALISKRDNPWFATTDNEYMKKTLAKAGFVQRGKEWKGKRGRLSLWIKD
jgi:predicted GNAT family N-acyltransferase